MPQLNITQMDDIQGERTIADTLPIALPAPWFAAVDESVGIWQDDARCSGLPHEVVDELFFPETGSPQTAGIAFCGGCDVRKQCYDFATRERFPYGLFGGETPIRRRERLDISLNRISGDEQYNNERTTNA